MEKGSRKKCQIISVGSPTPWDNLPSDILEIIFKKISLGDHVRVRTVCRHWNLVLSRAEHDILRIPHTPWQILLQANSHYVTQVSFRSLSDERIYRFNLPDDCGKCWFCGSSRGWLLMASGNFHRPHLFLWNPLNGSIRNLPPLSNHPGYLFYHEAIAGSMGILRHFDQVQVFSHGSADCVVVAILNRRACCRNLILLCTPHDERWTTFGEKEDKAIYLDVMYHERIGSLWLLTAVDLNKTHMMKTLRSRGRVCLSGCNLSISFRFVDRVFEDIDRVLDPMPLQRHFRTMKRARRVFRLVEDMVHEEREVLIMVTDIDREFHVCYRHRNREVMVRDRTKRASFIVPFEDRSSEELTSIGNRTVFLGSTGTNSIIISNPMEGIETDCVYMAIYDSAGYSYPKKRTRSFTIREQGVYSLKNMTMKNYNPSKVGDFPLFNIGWFEPKLFLK